MVRDPMANKHTVDELWGFSTGSDSRCTSDLCVPSLMTDLKFRALGGLGKSS
jgi:hypothetical protein